MTTRKMPLRLALREEGRYWQAYLAPQDSMEGALLMGSITIGSVRRNHELKQRFMDLMMDVMSEAIHEVLGVEPDEYIVEPGPESERSGHG